MMTNDNHKNFTNGIDEEIECINKIRYMVLMNVMCCLIKMCNKKEAEDSKKKKEDEDSEKKKEDEDSEKKKEDEDSEKKSKK